VQVLLMLITNDKIYHILVCALITIVTFFFLVKVLECYKRIRNRNQVTSNINDNDVEVALPATDEVLDNEQDMYMQKICIHLPERKYIIIGIISGLIAMSIGVAKEISDKYNIIWIGTASLGDILADFIGILLGYILLLLGYRCNTLYNDYVT